MSSSKYIKNDLGYFICPNCNVIKEKQNTMYYHMLKHEGKLPYECNICKKDFLQKAALDVHKASKHKDNNKNNTDYYVCCFNDCDFKSVTKANRRIHVMRKHFHNEIDSIIGDNNYCYACKMYFKSTASFYYHAVDCIQTNDKNKLSIITSII